MDALREDTDRKHDPGSVSSSDKGGGGGGGGGRTHSRIKRARVIQLPSCLQGRVEEGRALPVVEVIIGGSKRRKRRKDPAATKVVGPVVECVLNEMRVEMFKELMEMMG